MNDTSTTRRRFLQATGACLALLGLGSPVFAQDKDKAAADRKDARPLVFVITGESNSGGLGENRAATAAELAPRPCVQIMNLTSGKFQFEDLKIGVNNLREHRRLGQYETTHHGFELELANAVAEGAFPGHDRVYLIKTGQGGSRVKDWNEDQQDWKTFVKRIEEGKKQLPADAQWVVWLSLGINDGLAGNRNFQAEMRPYLDRVSKALPGAPIIMTGFQSMGYPEINKALAELSAERKGVSVIDSTGAKLADANHWNYDGLKLVTRRLIASPAFSKEAQGDWYVLAAHQNNKNITAAKGTGSKITITADGVVWPNPEKADAPFVSAKCVRAPASTDPKKPSDPNELISTVTGSLCPKQDAKLAARWKITSDNDVLLLLVEVAEYKGNRNGTYSGAAPSDVIFVCQRKPLPAASKPDPTADAKRIVGTWAILGELDDANCARTRPQGNVVFTATDFLKRGSYKADAKSAGGEGSWKLLPPQDSRGRIDFDFKSGIEFQGRSPSLYTFYGDDLLLIVYPEAEKGEALKNPDLRKPPTHFGSDGDRNMWILRRVTEGKK